jgi:DNA polymerase II large subunit
MEIPDYHMMLEKEAKRIYEIARAARAKNIDVFNEVEIPLTKDLAARVEGLVGPPGIADVIREYSKNNARGKVSLMVMNDIIEGKIGKCDSDEKRAERAVRTSLTILTEGVTAAGTEGISKVTINSNPDGTKYLSVFFAGPIRSAGGTAAAQAVLLTDYAQRLLKLQIYRPTETEIERYVEEIEIYHNAVTNLQYKPTDDEVRHIVRNCPVCIDGDPTEQVEVAVYKGIARVPTDRIRGGVCLVISEGIAQKAAKTLRFTKEHNLGWDWLEGLIRVAKKSGDEEEKTKPLDKYLGDIVGGRPIFAYPSMAGGFRLRYGRCRNTGIAAKGIHPATMVVLDEFPAIGTQFKIERPGKGAAMTPCDSIEPPVVRLKNGDVIVVDTISKAEEVKEEVEEILFLGDILISYGDFSKSNHSLLPAGFCEEWWELLAKAHGISVDPRNVSMGEAVEFSDKHKIPLHPKYTYFYGDIGKDELVSLVAWLKTGEIEHIETLEGKKIMRLILNLAPEKRILEKLCLPHRVLEGKIIINNASALLRSLNFDEITRMAPEKTTSLELINACSPFPIMDKANTYIGARMGRPEKAKERLMAPAPHGLVPVGEYGGKTRSIIKAAERGSITLDVPNLFCAKCNRSVFGYTCDKCGEKAEKFMTCTKCGRASKGNLCGYCGSLTMPFYKATIDMKASLENASKRVKEKPSPKLKGVLGTTNINKYFEPLEKAILRAKHSVFVFKDGTVRFDATDVPVTHVRPAEIMTSVEKMGEMGYDKDYLGNPLTDANQIVELKPQDILLAESGARYLTRTADFIDDLLERFYGLDRFYNVRDQNDLVGHFVIGLAPHTSVGVLGRIIGFTKAHAGYAHPYFHTAKRRNCDGDEDTVMLLMDALVNFSKCYLSDRRGSSMDVPLVLNIKIDPREVDDEVHEMEIVDHFPLEFYEAALKKLMPRDVNIEVVKHRFKKGRDSDGFKFTHDTTAIDEGPNVSRYVQLKTMAEKVDYELTLAEKIRAVDERDVAARILNFHFLRDIYGNLRAFGQQTFRCVECNEKYRRVPLSGKCNKCGGKLLLTVNKGGIEKYLRISKEIAQKYGLSDYLKQRLGLVEKDLLLLFPVEKDQHSLSEFM